MPAILIFRIIQVANFTSLLVAKLDYLHLLTRSFVETLEIKVWKQTSDAHQIVRIVLFDNDIFLSAKSIILADIDTFAGEMSFKSQGTLYGRLVIGTV